MVFDALNRVTTITHLGTANETLSSLSYTLDDTGRRTAITESNGRSSSYGYDELYRLTTEAITDPQIGNHFVASKHQKEFMKDLKPVYRACTLGAAETALD